MKEIILLKNLNAGQVVGKLLLGDNEYNELSSQIFTFLKTKHTLPELQLAYQGQADSTEPDKFYLQTASIVYTQSMIDSVINDLDELKIKILDAQESEHNVGDQLIYQHLVKIITKIKTGQP